jgi:hypothetical protein
MLITESQLNRSTSFQSILDEAVYLNEAESALSPVAIPVVENSRIGAAVVNFSDVERLAEENCMDYFEAVDAIAEANQISATDIAVAVDEARIIMDPEIVNECHNVVVRPISENSDAFIFVDMMLEAFENTGDVTFMNMLIDEDGEATDKQAQDLQNANAGSDKGGEKEVGTIRKWLDKIKYYAYTKPKEWIANKIAALNAKAEAYKEKTAKMGDEAPWYRKIVNMIMKAVAWLTAKMTSDKRREGAASALATKEAEKEKK